MNASSRFTVATHIMTVLAAKRIAAGADQIMKSDILAYSVNTNPVVIRRILSLLRNVGLVNTIKGPSGGSMLSRLPEKITLLDIYEAVEDGELFHLHYSCPSEACPVGANIQACLTDILAEAEGVMKKTLARKTLAHIAQDILDCSGISKKLKAGISLENLEAQYTFRNGKIVKK